MIGFSGISSPVYLDRFMIAGDAAGFVSLPTGEGIYYSMVSGEIAGDVAVEALRKKDFSKRTLKEYKKRTDQRIGLDMRWGPWLRRLALDRERDQEHVVRVSAKDSWFGALVRDMIVGDIPYNVFLWNLIRRDVKILPFFLNCLFLHYPQKRVVTATYRKNLPDITWQLESNPVKSTQ
jgi:flavin-dependent dehydrogenase